MNGWARASMLDAIDALVRSGRSDLASDLNRLVAKIDFEGLDVLRCPGTERIADSILEADTFSGLADHLGRLARAFGVSHCTLHVVGEGPATNFATKVLTTYPEEWVTRYVERRYSYVDPIGPACLTSSHSFFWDSLPKGGPHLAAFWEDAAAHGVGPSGCTQPITTERGDTIGISVCSTMEPQEFRDRFEGYESDLASLGIFLVDAFCRLASDDRPDTFDPNDDQLHVLRAVAMGVSEEELVTRAFRHGSYPDVERSICALFRTRTVAQAAVLAARIGLLADAPLIKTDILTSSDKVSTGRMVATRPSGASLRRLARIRTPVIDEDATNEKDARILPLPLNRGASA